MPRYRCPRCLRTCSVIPEGMFPRRSLPVERFEELADERLGVAGGGARPPPATVIEEGCIRRALRKLSERAPFLCGLLGQRLPLRARRDLSAFWRALRELGSTAAILPVLAREFKTSLLGSYRSLAPPDWLREPAPA